MNYFFYKTALFFQSMGFVCCQAVHLPTREIKRQMVKTKRKLPVGKKGKLSSKPLKMMQK